MTHYAQMHPVISIRPQSSTTNTAKYGKALKYWGGWVGNGLILWFIVRYHSRQLVEN